MSAHDPHKKGTGEKAAPASDTPVAAPRRPSLALILPVAIFAGIAILFAVALRSGDPSKLPSTFIGKPAPQTTFAALAGLTDARGEGQSQGPGPGEGPSQSQGFATADLATGRPSVVNFWASWCGPCVVEHPLLVRLKRETGVRLLGVNYKDKPSNARRFLARLKNPYDRVGVDPQGRGAVEWGVYGMPETFVLNGRGEIVYKHVGPLDPDVLRNKVLPMIRAMQKAAPAG
ncbi:MAG: DsbE family thiol:disulfide interchange protein [Pseudomonadota bacterium]